MRKATWPEGVGIDGGWLEDLARLDDPFGEYGSGSDIPSMERFAGGEKKLLPIERD